MKLFPSKITTPMIPFTTQNTSSRRWSQSGVLKSDSFCGCKVSPGVDIKFSGAKVGERETEKFIWSSREFTNKLPQNFLTLPWQWLSSPMCFGFRYELSRIMSRSRKHYLIHLYIFTLKSFKANAAKRKRISVLSKVADLYHWIAQSPRLFRERITLILPACLSKINKKILVDGS